MGKALRFSFYIIIVPVLAFFPSLSSKGFSQVAINDARTFEVSFTYETTERSQSGISISVHDLFSKSTVSELREGDVPRFTTADERQHGGFFVEAYDEISVGSYYHRTDEHVITELNFVNRTPDSFDKLSLAFDFIYLPVDVGQRINYQLSYRINGGEWVLPSGGGFHSDFFQTEEPGWSTFSMQISLAELFITPNDEIELRWSASGVNRDGSIVPIALQKMELQPSVASVRELRPGSLIITELMPRHRNEGGNLEYIKLYNSTESDINLKGLYLDAGYDEIVIQYDLIIPSYSAVVLANSDRPERIRSLADYRFSGTLLGNLSGRLDARFGRTEVARVMYDVSEPGIATRLDHLKNAYDGYSSMRYLVPVRRTLNNQTRERVGEVEPNRKLFTKEITRSGWHVLNPPGVLSESLNRRHQENLKPITALRVGDVQGEEESHQMPTIFYRDSAQGTILYSEGVESDLAANATSTRYIPGLNIGAIQTVTGNLLSPDRVRTSQGERAYPALLSWDNARQMFRLIHEADDTISAWDALFVPADVQNSYNTEFVVTDEHAGNGLNRRLMLTLSGEAGNNESVTYDEALIGFWNAPREANGMRMDLPKLWSPIHEEQSESRSPMIYLKSAESAHQVNSFLNVEYTPEEPVQVAAGIRLGQTNGRYTISWDAIESLPEQWHVEFVDADLDESIDMRRESSYSFFERSEQVLTDMRNPALNFQPVEETDFNRFFIRVSPSGTPSEFDESFDMSDTIELRHNYPNPFNPSTTIVFYLPKASDVKVSIYNVVGQQVGVLRDDRMSAGEHSVIWNAMDMPSGVYIVQLEAGNRVDTRKITLIK